MECECVQCFCFSNNIYSYSDQYEWSELQIKCSLCKCKTEKKVDVKRKENEMCKNESKCPTWSRVGEKEGIAHHFVI